MDLDDADIAAITALISLERLAALTKLTGSARAAIELHQETLSLGSNLMGIIASVEIAIRNAVCENLTTHFGVSGWLTRPVAPFRWKDIENSAAQRALDSARRAEYSKMSQADKAALDAKAYPRGRPPNTPHMRRAIDRRKQIPVTEGKIIAEITFYFWKRLYGPEYEQSLWRPTLKKTFPNKSLKRSDVAKRLEDVYQARNRLAHHEPVLHKRFNDTIAGLEFIAENLLAPAPAKDTPLAKLIADDLQRVKDNAQALHDKLDAFRTGP